MSASKKYNRLYMHFIAFIFFFSFGLSMADNHTLAVYEFNSDVAGYILSHKTYAIDEYIHPERTGTSQIYRDQSVYNPKLPMFHPYEEWNHNPDVSIGSGIPQVPLVLHVSNDHLNDLPAPMLQRIRSTGVTDVIISVVAQNMPWQETTPILFRPHYGMHPDAPSRGTHHIKLPSTVGLFYSDNGNLSLDRMPINEFKDEEDVVLHFHGKGEWSDMLVLSGDILHVQNLTHRTPQSVWSYVEYIDSASNTRTALATLHWLLDDVQVHALYDIFQHESTGFIPEKKLDGLFTDIEHHPAFDQKGGGIIKLKELLRK